MPFPEFPARRAENIAIAAVAHGGDGVCRIEGQVCFVPYALPGDRADIRIVRQSKGVLRGQIETIREPSPHRVEATCPRFGVCGGCSWLHFDHATQLEWKRQIVQETLARLGGIETDVRGPVAAEPHLGYRTRAEFHARSGRFGFFAAGTHEVVDMPECPLCHPRMNAVVGELRAMGVSRDIEIVVHPEGEDVLLWSRDEMPAIRKRFAGFGTLRDRTRAGFRFDAVPIVNGTFSQSSLLLNRMLVREVHGLLGSPATLLDLYCGTGNFSIGLAARVRVTGLDHNRAAIAAARELDAGDYRAGDESAFARALERPWDAILIDPPREGAKALVPVLVAAPASLLVYVSCDPATLARDLKALVAGGWRLVRALAVDMFPHTAHIETVCRLER